MFTVSKPESLGEQGPYVVETSLCTNVLTILTSVLCMVMLVGIYLVSGKVVYAQILGNSILH